MNNGIGKGKGKTFCSKIQPELLGHLSLAQLANLEAHGFALHIIPVQNVLCHAPSPFAVTFYLSKSNPIN